MKSKVIKVAIIAASLSFGGVALAGEEHGHCSGPNVCGGDAACEKQGWKELTEAECAKIDGAKFTASDHAGEDHKDEKHEHDKK